MFMQINGVDVTQLIQAVSTSGGKNQSARMLTASITQTPYDNKVPVVKIETGMTLTFEADGHSFMGVIFSVTASTSSNSVDIKAFDLCIYLQKNEISYKADHITPEAMAKAICKELSIPYGTFEKTGHRITQFFFGVSAYDAIMTAYTEASKETGEKYIMRAKGTQISVDRRGAYVAAIIKPMQNMIEATYSESIDNAVNRVEVRNKDGSIAFTIDGDTSYGVLCSIIQDSDTARADAKKMLEDSEKERTASVVNLGNPECITGNAVIVHEPFTGLDGLFYIDADTHTWKNGVYTNKLTLNFKNIMDEREAKDHKINIGTSDDDYDMTIFDPYGEEYGDFYE